MAPKAVAMMIKSVHSPPGLAAVRHDVHAVQIPAQAGVDKARRFATGLLGMRRQQTIAARHVQQLTSTRIRWHRFGGPAVADAEPSLLAG
ncbi:hypothetical protein [Paraburkholderia strydomiana]|uniref:hypothetical protein n=1 Tax=Paraburkholderia strydomiana TaxID=1245417 RepID=UPI001BE52227|nr:hypothetical protein [Paraburkholderia strydomiana]MBT2794285.1 hypothetical protein [Paraburkholderia strydomiana]